VELLVRFAEVGAQSAIAVTTSGPSTPVVSVAEVTAGGVATAEVQRIAIQQSVSATFSTAVAAPTVTLTETVEDAQWTVAIDERTTGGQWRLTVSGAAKAWLPFDATAAQVSEALGTGYEVNGDHESGFVIDYTASTGTPTLTATGRLTGLTGISGAFDAGTIFEVARRNREAVFLTVERATTTGARRLIAAQLTIPDPYI
jgi:hypothetical protein